MSPTDDPAGPGDRHQPPPVDPDVLGVIALGGAAGAVLRHGVAELVPRDPGGFPWATFVVNVTGCLAIGLLMVAVACRWPRSRYVRPLLGVGVLGGFTTFSTYALESRDLVAEGAAPTSVLYVVASVGAGLLAVVAGLAAGEALVRSRPAHRPAP